MNSQTMLRSVSLSAVLLVAGPMMAATVGLPAVAQPPQQPQPAALPVPPAGLTQVEAVSPPRTPHPATARSEILLKQLVQKDAAAEDVVEKQLTDAQKRIERIHDMSLIMREPELRWTAKRALERQTLIIPNRDPDPKVLKEMAEDLNVMTCLLERECDLAGSKSRIVASGIDLMVLPGATTAIRHLHLQGSGAVILLQAPFPLRPPETKPSDQKEETRRSTAWEEARRDVYGVGKGAPGRDAFRPRARAKAEVEYDSKRVERLKDQLWTNLKEATNMRHLGQEESLTIVVQSTSARKDLEGSSFLKPEDEDFEWGNDRVREATGIATLLVKARKKDIDACAAGTLSQDEFIKASTLLLY